MSIKKRTVGFVLLSLLIASPLTRGSGEWFDYFGRIPWDEEQAHFYSAGVYLRKAPELILYVAYCAESQKELRERRGRVQMGKRFLSKELKIKASRIVIVNGGKCSETLTILQPMQKGREPLQFFPN
jgi:hypothetical protein